MALKSPSSIDTLDIQFKLYAKTKITNISESIPDNVSLLSVSSAQGLLFVGDPEKTNLKVFMLNNLIDTENICNEILVRSVPLPGVPNIVVCSCDGSMLAVSYRQHGASFLQILSVPSFLTANIITLHTIKLSPEENATALQILWNPVISCNLAIVLTNGALSMYTFKDGGQYEMHNLDKSQQVQCGCWSPKGKQIVLGFANGKLQQFKPDLTPAKTIVCPVGIHEGPFSTIAVHWLSTFQFAVAFVQDGENMVPSLYIVNAPKGGAPSYINYYDVCYTTGQRANQMSFIHIQQWNVLLVTSSNGVEVGLLGCKESGETPTWTQYTLLDEARIEMPLTESKDETFPIGLAFDNSCTHHLTINDKELPVMPMIHVLSSNGLLLSFNFLNLAPGAADVCSPPPPISYNTEQFRPLDLLMKELEAHSEKSTTAIQQDKAASVAPTLVTSTPMAKDKAPQLFGNNQTAVSHQSFQQSTDFGSVAKTPLISTPTTSAVFKGFGGIGTVTTSSLPSFDSLGGQQQKLDQQQATQPKPQAQPHLQQQFQQQTQQQQQKPQQSSTVAVSGVKSSELNKPLYTVPPNFTPPTTAVIAQQAQPQKSQSNLTISSKMQSGFLELILVQINAFEKEIKQLAIQSKGLLKNLGDPDEMRGCTKRLNDLQEIIEQANDHEFEMDVQNLRHFLNEARSMIAECRWKLEKYKNPELPRLGNNASDAVNRRQLAKLQSYLATNEAQLQALKMQIDAQWSNFQDSVRRKSKTQIHIPCLDGIYQRMTKLQETLSLQRQKLNQIKSKLQQKGLLYKVTTNDTSRGYVNVESTIDSLADSILSMTLAQVVDENRSKLSNEKLNAIRDFTRQRQTVNIIKPHRPNRVGLKSEVVLETMLQSERIKARENNAPTLLAKKDQSKQKVQSVEDNPVVQQKPASTKSGVPATQAPLSTSTTSPAFSFNNMNANSSLKAGTTAEKDVKPAATTFNFKTTPTLSGFGMPQAHKSNVEATKIGISTPEEDLPNTQATQVPISFAAKVISGQNTISKNTAMTFAPTNTAMAFPDFTADAIKTVMTDKEPETDKESPKAFSFTTAVSSAANSTSIFSGLGSTTNAATTKPQIVDVRSGTGFAASFSFGGITSSAGNTAPVMSTPIASSKPTTTIESSANANPAVSIFSGFGKSVGLDNNTVPLNLSAPVSTASPSLQSLTKSSQSSFAPTASTKSETVATSTTKSTTNSTPPSTASDVAETFLGGLNICKPSTKPSDLTKSSSVSGNIFAGLGSSSGFSFTPVTGAAGSLSFGDLSKSLTSTSSLTITPVATAIPTTSTTSSSGVSKDATTILTITTTTPATISTSISSTPSALKPTDFSFSLSSSETSVATPTATQASTPVTTSSSANALPTAASTTSSIFSSGAAGIFANAAFSTTTTTTSTTVSSSAPSLFSATSGSTFFTSTPVPMTATVTTTSAVSSIFGGTSAASLTSSFGGFNVGTATATTASTTHASGGSIFAAAAAGTTSPSNANIFGGIPKPDQSVFSATPSQPNQTVGSGIFGGGTSFAKPTGTIFGGAASATSLPSAGSPFGSAAAPTVTSGGSIFGGSAIKPADGSNIFSAAAVQPAAPAGGGSIFGQSSFGQPGSAAPPTSNLFGGSSAPQQTFGTAGSIFGTTNTSNASSGSSIFGGGGTAAVAPSAFGSPTNTGASTGFDAFSQPNTGSPFSPTCASSGPFGQGGASVAQSGFGSPQQASAFSKPVFGGPPTFGSPPAFGAQPIFGGAPTFGTQKGFGTFASASPTSPSVFGGGAQKNNLFETLGSSDTGLSFGNLAQGAGTTGPKPPFGGSSFTSYRS